MTNLDPSLIARALNVMTACGGVLAVLAAFAAYDEYRVRKQKASEAPIVAASTMLHEPAESDEALVDS